MLTAESLVAKVLTFIVEKTVGKLAALPFDKRKKACRSLTKLYYSVQALDEATAAILETFESFVASDSSNASALVHALNNHMHDIDLATNMFIDLGHELYGGLEIIDPALADCCQLLYVGKGDFLHFMSNSIEWKHHGSESTITLKRPTARIEAVDMDAMYADTQTHLAKGEKHYWPESALDDYYTEFQNVSISFADAEAADALLAMIRRQNALLKEAKERLRELLKNKFHIEEILFQSDSHPYR